MPLAASPYYTNPYVGQVVQNLTTAIFGDPEARMRRDVANSEIGERDANARLLTLKGNLVDRQDHAQGDLATALATLFAPAEPGETPAAHLQKNIANAATILNAGGGNAAQLTTGLNNLFATSYGLGDDNDMTRSLVLRGKAPNADFAPSTERADAVSARNAGEDQGKAFGVANINQAGENSRNAVNEAGRNARFYNAPINIAKDASVTFAPTDPRSKSLGSTIFGPKTDSSKTGKLRQVKVAPADVDKIVFEAAQTVPGAVTQGDDHKLHLDPDFIGSFDPALEMRARAAASDAYHTTGDAMKAAQTYLQTLHIQPGTKFEPADHNMAFWNNHDAGIVPPPMTPSAARPKAAAPTKAPPATKKIRIDLNGNAL